MSMNENIDQHKRKRHTEFDHIFQVKQWMDATPRVGTGKLLDPMQAIDVAKYGLLMGDPLNPGEIPSGLVALLTGKPPTPQN